jgi:hypothetical protein
MRKKKKKKKKKRRKRQRITATGGRNSVPPMICHPCFHREFVVDSVIIIIVAKVLPPP